MLTERQTEIYHFIVEFIAKQGHSPTMREICEGTYLASSSSACRYIRRFEKEGLIRIISGRARSIELNTENTIVTVVKVKERQEGIPSVIEVAGRRYIYDPA